MNNSNPPLKPKESSWMSLVKDTIGKAGSYAETPTKEDTSKGWTEKEKQDFLKGYNKKP